MIVNVEYEYTLGELTGVLWDYRWFVNHTEFLIGRHIVRNGKGYPADEVDTEIILGAIKQRILLHKRFTTLLAKHIKSGKQIRVVEEKDRYSGLPRTVFKSGTLWPPTAD